MTTPDAATLAHPAVRAVLAVTVADREGFVVSEYDEESNPLSGVRAELDAARKAVAALAWAAGFVHSPADRRRLMAEAAWIKNNLITEESTDAA